MQQILRFKDMRRMALGYVGDTLSNSRYDVGGGEDAQGQGASMCSIWMNEGQHQMCMDLGIEEVTTLYTAVGQREYPLPVGITKIRAVYYNGTKLRYARDVDLDWFSSGTSYADRYAIRQKKLLLGMLPPSAAYPVKIFHFREPRQLIDDADEPDVPNRFRMGIVKWAAAEMCNADESFALATALKRDFQQYKNDFNDWVDGQSTETLQVANVTDGWCFYRL